MSERVSSPDSTPNNGHTGPQDSPGFVIPLPEVVRDPRFEPAHAFLDYCDAQQEFQELPEYEQLLQKPELARRFIRAAVIRNNPGIENTGQGQFSLLFDEVSVRQNIARFQKAFGAQSPRDPIRFQRRFDFQGRFMSLANSFGNRPEYQAAAYVDDLFHALGDTDTADSFATLITAYGMTLEAYVRPIGEG